MAKLPIEQIYAIETSEDEYYQKDGQPVWPVRNQKERDALESMVSTLGHRIEYIQAADRGVLGGEEIVIGLGPAAHKQAELYAHLTLRSCVKVDNLHELATLAVPAVVVTTYNQVNEDLFDLLYDRFPSSTAPGVVFSFDDEGLALQVLTKSVALHCCYDRFHTRRVDINATIDFGIQEADNYRFLGGNSEPRELRAALASNPGLLTLYTHSDGIDAYLRDNLVLCPIQKNLQGDQPEPAPSCVVTGICHRCRMAMSEVLGSDVLLEPEIVKANILIYTACWGLYPSQKIHSSAYSLSRRFLESFTVGALITSWEINIQRLPATSRLFHDVARGLTLGEALSIHLSSEEARETYNKLCLIGDPGIRLSPSNIADPLGNIQVFKKPPAPQARFMAGLTLLRLMVDYYTEEGDHSPEMLGASTSYEKMMVSGHRYDSAMVDRFRRRLVNYLSSQDTMISKSWFQYSDDIRTLKDKPDCSFCGRRSIAREYDLRIAGATSRRETMCPSCGSIEDAPVHRQMSMTVDQEETVHLSGQLPTSDWQARIIGERFFTRTTQTWEWPSDDDGNIQTSFQLPDPMPGLPFRLAVVLVYDDCEFTVLGGLQRGVTPFEPGSLADS